MEANELVRLRATADSLLNRPEVAGFAKEVIALVAEVWTLREKAAKVDRYRQRARTYKYQMKCEQRGRRNDSKLLACVYAYGCGRCKDVIRRELEAQRGLQAPSR